jgi:hypothetical protein
MLKEIYILDEIADSPASSYIQNGIILVSAKHFDTYPTEYRFFILLHEYFHITAYSRDEELVDQLAFEEYAKRGYSLKKLIDCMVDVLTLQAFESHRKRASKLLLQAQQYDRKYGNQATK